MRIEGPRRLDQTAGRAAARSAGGGSFAVETVRETRSAASAAQALPLGALDQLLALQEAAEPLTGRKRAISRASDMLDLLDDIKLGLLGGGIPRSTLGRLQMLVRESRDEFEDPRLKGVIDEIDLRAQVELAKLEIYG
jgi:hypothetical protein